MTGYTEGDTVIVYNKGRYQVAMIVGKSNINKKTLYDVLLETRSIIAAVPRGAVSKQAYIDDNLTKKLISTGEIESTIPEYNIMVDQWLIPAYNETSSGPRSF
jgi:predicted ABC-class ATPase